MKTINHFKKYLFLIALIGFLVVFTGCQDDINPPAASDTAITLAAIAGVTVPVTGETPATAIMATDQYTGTVTWSPADATFAASAVYTATITLTPKTGYTLTGVTANSFTVAGATATNPINSGVVTAVFPTTAATPPTVINLAAIPGITVPVRAEAPVTTAIDTAQYTGSVTWNPADIWYAANKVYTATITLTAKAGYTLNGVSANFFTVAGVSTAASNPINSGVVTAVFPKTDVAPPTMVTITAIPGVTVPKTDETPDTTAISSAQYTGSITWSPVVVTTYLASTEYTATITLTAKTGFTLDGITENFFTVLGATVTNPADSGAVQAAFPATALAAPTMVDIAPIPGVTAPILGEVPVTEISETLQYTGSVTWDPEDSLYAGSTAYTATITLTAKDNFTLTGVGQDFFSVAGATTVSNLVNSGVVTATFPTTNSGTVPLLKVDLGAAGNYAILAQTLISTTGSTAITGDIAISPAATTYITGFGLVDDTGFATSSLVTGKVYSAVMAAPTPANLTTAVANMITAYNDAAGRPTPKELNLGTGAIGGMTLEPGLYRWESTVNIGSNLTLNGGANDIWIFQITNNLNLANGFEVLLTGGAKSENIFWQVAEIAKLGTNSKMKGTILSMTDIVLQTGSSINGKLLAQTQVTLDAATVVDSTSL